MFKTVTGAFACCFLSAATGLAQSGVDFRAAAESTRPATVAVVIGANEIDRTIQHAWQHGLPINKPFLTPWALESVAGGATIRSGFAVSPDLVISCEVPNTEEVKLRTHDGSVVTGRVVARDDVTGLAAIRVDGGQFSGVALAGEPAAPGTPVLVHWLANGRTVTSNGSMIATDPHADHSEVGFCQTLDSVFLPNKLGAPVIDAEGTLVGIAVGFSGTTVCLPAAHVTRLVQAASADEPSDLKRGRLGIRLDEHQGAMVTQVSAEMPAAEAGLVAGDKITRVNDHQCRDHYDVMAAVAMARAGDEVTLEIQRGDETLQVTVTLVGTDDQPRVSRYEGKLLPRIATQLYQFKDGKLSPMNNAKDGGVDLPELNLPQAPILGNLLVERSKLEESLKRLEAESKKLEADRKEQGSLIEKLQEQLEDLRSPDPKAIQEELETQVNKIVEDLKKQLEGDQSESP